MICALDIKIAQRQGRSYLQDAYVTQPFRIVPVGQYKRDMAAYLMMMSSSPGLLDGDDHRISVQLAAGTALQLQTQAYQRLYHMKEGSSQHITVRMEPNSSFSYVPHPVVPQHSSRFQSINRIRMQKDCQVLWSDIITCGRKMSGESFVYHHFQACTEIYMEERLLMKDNVLLQPHNMPVGGMGMLEGYTHQGTLIYYNTKGISVQNWIDRFYERYHQEPATLFGITALQGDGFMLRILGTGGEQLFSIFQEIQTHLWESEFVKQNN